MPPSRPNVHLIDGSGYIFRAYYAVRPLSTHSGLPTNAVLGFARMLLKLLRESRPALLGIAFDTAADNFRHAIYADYKANREAPPEDLQPQFALIHELVEALQIPVLMRDGYEADDLIASLCRQAHEQHHDVTVVSADKDLMQLVGPHVSMVDPMFDRIYDAAAVQEKFGVPPHHIADLLALAGDSSDNVPGVPRVGIKTAAKLVATYGDVEAILAALPHLEKPRATDRAVLEHAAQARLSKRLTVLDAAAPIHLDLDKLRYREPDPQRLGPLLHRLEARSLLRDLAPDWRPPGEAAAPPDAAAPDVAKDTADAAPQAAPFAAPPGAAIDRSRYRTILQRSELVTIVQHLRQVGRLSVDLETTSLEAARAEIVGVALAAPGMLPAYVPVRHHYLGVPKQLALATVLELLAPLLEDRRIAKVGQHLKYDSGVLHRAGVALRGIVDDSLVAAYVVDPARPSYRLDALSRDILGHQTIAYGDVCGTGKNKQTFDAVNIDVATSYAAEDADVALRLCDALLPQVEAAGGQQVYRQIEMPLVEVLAAMEQRGARIDTAQLQALSKEFSGRLAVIEAEAFKLIGAPINLDSPKQLSYLFFEKLGYPPVKKTKTGYSTDQEVLEVLAKTYELPQVILNHRLLTKLRSTYVEALPRMVVEQTGRVHTHYNQAGTATGRLSSSDPNLQNIPIRSDDGRRIRSAFVPPDGWCLISADYSQIELRLMAHLSQDEAFVEAFQRGEDIHARTAREILGHLPTSDAEKRRRAKAINFGILYGLSEYGLARQLQIPRAEAHAYILAYFARYPRIRGYLDDSIEAARRSGFVATLTGRRRYLPNLRSHNGNLRQAAERIAMNTPIQGSAADLIKLAMLRVHDQLQRQRRKARLILQVHDELVVEAPRDERAAIVDLLRESMVEVMSLRVPLEVEVGHGDNWADAH